MNEKEFMHLISTHKNAFFIMLNESISAIRFYGCRPFKSYFKLIMAKNW